MERRGGMQAGMFLGRERVRAGSGGRGGWAGLGEQRDAGGLRVYEVWVGGGAIVDQKGGMEGTRCGAGRDVCLGRALARGDGTKGRGRTLNRA